MPMKNPPHVGGIIRREVIKPLDLSVTEAAGMLGIGRQALSSLLNETAALSPEMALRIEKAFGPKMEHMMRMQLAYDLAQARKHESEMKYPQHGMAFRRSNVENFMVGGTEDTSVGYKKKPIRPAKASSKKKKRK